jgi:hypothetical protein
MSNRPIASSTNRGIEHLAVNQNGGSTQILRMRRRKARGGSIRRAWLFSDCRRESRASPRSRYTFAPKRLYGRTAARYAANPSTHLAGNSKAMKEWLPVPNSLRNVLGFSGVQTYKIRVCLQHGDISSSV